MAKKFLVPIDLSKLELQNAVIQVLAADPSSPIEGQIYYNSVNKKLRQYNGTVWLEYGTGTGTGDVTQASNSGGAGRMKVSAGATKAITDLSGVVGIIKTDTNGVVSVAVSGTDYAPATSGSGILKGNGSGGFSTAVANTDYATPAYVDSAVTGLLDYKGSIDASANPNFPAASKGDFYKISVAGKIGGASGTVVQAGDNVVANADNAGGTLASVGTSWDVYQGNVEAATTSAVGYVELATQAETEAKTDTVRAVTPASLANFPQKKTATIGDGSTTAISVTDSLGTKDKIANVRDASTDAEVICDITYGTNTTTFTFAVAPATNAYKVVIIG